MPGRRFARVIGAIFALLTLCSGTHVATAQEIRDDATIPVGDGSNATCLIPPPLDVPLPGVLAGAGRFRSFREPLPPAPLWNPSGTLKVGLQAGHWLVEERPFELRGLQGGTSGGGMHEWQVNLELAQRTAAILEDLGVEVDILPTTVPIGYRAHLFLSIHADGDVTGQLRGYKAARPGFSSIPQHDDQLVEAIMAEYGRATGLPPDLEHVSNRMRFYYAFNSRRYCHSVAPGVPQVILETGFLTNATDRQWLIGDPDLVARGIAAGVSSYLFRWDRWLP